MSIKSRITQWLIGDLPKQREIYKFTDEDRENSAKVRNLKSETARTLQEIELVKTKNKLREVQDILSDYDDDNDEPLEDSAEKMLMTLLLPLLAPKIQQQQETQTPIHPLQQEQTEAEIRGFIQSLDKKVLKQLKKMDDVNLKVVAKQYFPNLTDNDLSAAVNEIRNI